MEMWRRNAIRTLAGAAFAAKIDARPRFRDDPFKLGVASGDPQPDSVVLWTRLAPNPLEDGGMPPETVPVEWRVATDEKLSHVVASGTALATPQLAHSVHVAVRGLPAGRWFWYQFFVGSTPNRLVSPVGRTRTAPNFGANQELRFAFASCQKYEDGYFTAYERVAEEELDLIVHLGDYIYEGAANKKKVRPHPFAQAFTLQQYRQRYALYRSDPALQRAHGLFPWAVVWDDHETSDNYAGMIPDWDSPQETFAARRAAAYQAYFEHMPLRPSASPHGPDLRLYRQLRYGALANIYLMDTRQYRSDQPCGDRIQSPCPERASLARTMLGADQEQWLFDSLSTSTAQWNVLAQQVIVAQLDLEPGPDERYPMDKWDGYPAARDRLMAYVDRRKLSNMVVLSGDNHNNWVFDLKRDFRNEKAPVLAAEFSGTSITSNGDGSEESPEYASALRANPHIRFHNSQRGYVRCRVTEKLWHTDFRVVPYVSRPGAPVQTKASFVVERGRPGAAKA